MQTFRFAPVPLQAVRCLLALLFCLPCRAAVPKVHTVTLGPARKVPYTPPQIATQTATQTAAQTAPQAESTKPAVPLTLKVRTLNVDGRQKEWTTGEIHEVTDRSFTVRRALRLNDALPGETAQRWSWQPGPWLLVDRTTGHITALHLPDFDALVSDAVWFRDYAAYCGTGTTAKGGLYVVVAQLGARRPVVQKQIGKWPLADVSMPVCTPAEWRREPLRVSLGPVGTEAMTFDVVGAAALIEEGDSADGQ